MSIERYGTERDGKRQLQIGSGFPLSTVGRIEKRIRHVLSVTTELHNDLHTGSGRGGAIRDLYNKSDQEASEFSPR